MVMPLHVTFQRFPPGSSGRSSDPHCRAVCVLIPVCEPSLVDSESARVGTIYIGVLCGRDPGREDGTACPQYVEAKHI